MYYRHITSERRWTDLHLQEVWRYRDLIWLFTKRSFALSYKQTILGPLWLLLNPLFTSLVYVVVFGGIVGIGTDGIPQLLFYLVGTAAWTFFSSCVTSNASTFTSNAYLFSKVYFPRLTVPLSQMLSDLIRLGIQLALALLVLVYYLIKGAVHPIWWMWPLLPLLVLEMGLMGAGVGLVVSSLTTKYRDLSTLLGFGVRLWMFVTPVIYPLSQLSGRWASTLAMLNPVCMPMELFRMGMLGTGTFIPSCFAWSLVFTAIVVVFGLMIFSRVERTSMDTV